MRYFSHSQALIEAGANVNSAGPKDNTALHLASGKGMNTAVKTLVVSGANVNAPGQLKERPLHTVHYFSRNKFNESFSWPLSLDICSS